MTNLKTVLEIWFSRQIFIRSVKTALVVGVILAFINHGDLVVSGVLTPDCWIKMALTTLVPYSVASWTAMTAQMEKLEPT